MLVKATDMSVKLRVGIKELHRIANPGEQFEVSDLRYEILAGNNKFKAIFVIPVKPREDEVIQKKKKSTRAKRK